ncbi:MAG: D-alanyl-D-alanine carboxypeptidase/D-alanyl-D-alanine-endopeptidase [Zoogloeaceae bacterium]|nr:D-alanyl-D-alanine carboxypeptidase/D-alanyl-D-alanine-endopeptidase [Zoogloeaceae bacterium]
MKHPRFVLFALLILLPGALLANGLPPPVEQALKLAGIPSHNVAVWVQAVDADRPGVSVNATRPMNPASVMKLVTAFAALERLGPGFTWKTRVAADGRIRDGRLTGNLHLVGSGDPLLDIGRLWKLFARLRASGLTHVDGDFVLDGSALRLPPHDASAFDNRPLRPYNSGPNGLLLNFNTVQIHLTPGLAAGDPIAVAAVPVLDGLRIDNRFTTTAGRCGTWFRDLDAALALTPKGPQLTLTGSMPADCGPRDWSAAPLTSADFSAALVRWLWRESGGSVSGQVRWGATPTHASTLFEHLSPPAAEAVREMNKWSSNVIATQLLASLGLEEPDSLDMIAAGARIAGDTLAAAGIPTQDLVIENGSGLSRHASIRTDALGRLLIEAWNKPWMPEFVSSLSLAGIDGTARRRLTDSPANGRAHLKTGTINGVRAMAGYVLDRNGRRHAVVMMLNDTKASQSEAAQDALIEWVWGGAER